MNIHNENGDPIYHLLGRALKGLQRCAEIAQDAPYFYETNGHFAQITAITREILPETIEQETGFPVDVQLFRADGRVITGDCPQRGSFLVIRS